MAMRLVHCAALALLGAAASTTAVTTAAAQEANAQSAPAAQAAPAAPASPRTGAAIDPDTRVERRLLHPHAGGVLREESRKVGDHWEVQKDGQWTALPAGLIESVRSESDVLEEWRKQKSGVGKLDDGARVTLAEWGLEQGLYKEALAQLDDVLERDSDQPAARALLARPDLPIRVPSAADPLDFAATAPPALRELALQRVVARAHAELPPVVAITAQGADETAAADDAAAPGDAATADGAAPRDGAAAQTAETSAAAAAPPGSDAPVDALHADLDRRLLDRKPGNRAMAALALRRLAAGAEPAVSGFSQDELAELLRRSVRDVSPPVREQAALALRDAREEGLLLPLFKALGSSSSAIRTNAAQAMGLMEQPRAVEPLVVRLLTLKASGGDDFPAARSNIFVGRQIAFVQGFDVEVAQNAAIGKPQVGTLQDGASLDVSVLGVSGGGGGSAGYSYMQEGEELCKALERLTGAKPGRTKADWQRWWNENRASWVGKS